MLLGFNKRFWTLVTCLVIAGITFMVYPGYARQQDSVHASVEESVSIGEVADPGILLNSPFYFTKIWSRAGRLFFAFESQKKAELALRFANEDALAIKELCEKEEYISTGKQCGEFQEQFQGTLKWTEQARQEGKDIKELMAKLKEDHLSQQQVLASVLEKVPEWAREGILIAMENSSSLLENAVEVMQGKQEVEQFRGELSLQFSNVDREIQIRIQQRLGTRPRNSETTADSITIPALVNHPPIITSLIANDYEVIPADKCYIECSAEDHDGNSLNYMWSASKGDISGTGSSAIWTAPEEEDSYDITVTVSDGHGGEEVKSLTIGVQLPDPPVIEQLIVTPAEPKYFVKQLVGYVILRGKSCEIECVASGGGKLSFDWSASEGDISGTGCIVTWTAPSHKCSVTLSVTVSDESGNVVSEEILFHVRTCRPCFV
jgi:hypothetical protein